MADLNEEDCVDAIEEYLRGEGYADIETKKPTQKGVDITARALEKNTLLVEVKGATSSRENSNRFKKPFTSQQIKSHVAKAIWKAMEMKQNDPDADVAIGLPHTEHHATYVARVSSSLGMLGVDVFWVEGSREVRRTSYPGF